MTQRGKDPGRFRWRAVAVLGGGAVLMALALLLAMMPVVSRPTAPVATGPSQTVLISMAGFSPEMLSIPAHQAVTLTLVNSDSQYHTDGGGWHQFAIDALRLDVRVPPRGQKTVTLGPLPPGRYEFYCGVCCGGKSNPSMIGILEVQG